MNEFIISASISHILVGFKSNLKRIYILIFFQAQFALNTATILLDYYDEYFNTPYPLEKQGELSF